MSKTGWIKKLDDYVKARGEADTTDAFPASASPDEKAAGFLEIALPRPNGSYAFESANMKAVIRPLGDNLMAVKMMRPDKKMTYAIWDADRLAPVEEGAFSLAELRARYKF